MRKKNKIVLLLRAICGISYGTEILFGHLVELSSKEVAS